MTAARRVGDRVRILHGPDAGRTGTVEAIFRLFGGKRSCLVRVDGVLDEHLEGDLGTPGTLEGTSDVELLAEIRRRLAGR